MKVGLAYSDSLNPFRQASGSRLGRNPFFRSQRSIEVTFLLLRGFSSTFEARKKAAATAVCCQHKNEAKVSLITIEESELTHVFVPFRV